MKHEIEMKFRVADLAGFAGRVERAGGRRVDAQLQTDTYFDTPSGSLRRRDTGLRLRTEEPLNITEEGCGPSAGAPCPYPSSGKGMGKAMDMPFRKQRVRAGHLESEMAQATAPLSDAATASTIVTYKGPRQGGRAKNRVEIETAVSDGRAVVHMLAALGLSRRLVVQKRRVTYSLGRCMVCLDELPLLGGFVEIEGAGEETIDAVARKLSLTGEPLRSHYAELASQALARAGRRDGELTFDSLRKPSRKSPPRARA